jgi:GMP synthase-like glutamine amidotransferase
VDVLAVIHGDRVRAGVFGEVVEERGHRLDEWSLAWQTPLPQPLDSYGAVLVFGGAMHADQDDRHSWLRDEDLFLQRLLMLHVPVLGVCLGAQLLAKAAGASVYRAVSPEVGWFEVELSADARDDPIFARLPARFEAFQWHYYTHDLPGGAVELAKSAACTQAFRLGESAWGIQFHAEVTLPQVESWLEHELEADDRENLPGDLLETTRSRIGGWNDLGRTLSGAFIETAERVAVPA